MEAGSKIIHKVVNTGQPPQIFNLLTFPRIMRNTARINIKNVPRTKKCRRSTIYRIAKIFNNLPNNLKWVHPKMFKRAISKRKIQEIPDE